LSTETLAQLTAFRNRASAARVANAQFKESKVNIDFEHYRALLKNKEIVAEGEKIFKSFKPVDYDVQAQLKAISAFEGKAVSYRCIPTLYCSVEVDEKVYIIWDYHKHGRAARGNGRGWNDFGWKVGEIALIHLATLRY